MVILYLNEGSNIMADLAFRFFDNRCFVDHTKFKPTGFVLHHLRYIDNDVTRDQYPKGEKGRFYYLKALKPMVEKEPFRFALIRNTWHSYIDGVRKINGPGLARLKRENLARLIVLVLLTEPKHGKRKK